MEKILSEEELKKLKDDNSSQIKKVDKLISIIIISTHQKIHYSIIFKCTYKFAIVDKFLYDKYQEYKEEDISFFYCMEKKLIEIKLQVKIILKTMILLLFVKLK